MPASPDWREKLVDTQSNFREEMENWMSSQMRIIRAEWIIFFIIFFKIYWFEKQSDRPIEIFYPLVQFSNAHISHNCAGESQDAGTQPESPTLAGTLYLSCHCYSLGCVLVGNWIGSGVAGTEPGITIWDAGVQTGSYCYPTYLHFIYFKTMFQNHKIVLNFEVTVICKNIYTYISDKFIKTNDSFGFSMCHQGIVYYFIYIVISRGFF